MKTVTLEFSIEINADPKTIFDYVSDWEKQSDWIMFTTVKKISNSINKQGTEVLATTKIGFLKVVDTMVVTEWQPSEKIIIEHTGRVVLGKGVFTVHKISDNTSSFIWQEITPIPFGLIGQVGLVVVKPIMNAMFGRSLKKLKANIESK